MIAIGNYIGKKRNFSWATYWMTQYKSDVAFHKGSIIDNSYTSAEIKKAVNEGYFDKIAYWVDKKFGVHAVNGENIPLVSFSYDDGRDDDYVTYQHFAAKGAGRGTSFICTSFIGTPNYLTWEQIAEMYNDGWDFQCHTWSHARSDIYGGDVDGLLGLTGCTEEQIIEQLVKSNEDFLAHGLPLPKHLAYPNYLTTPAVAKIVGQYRKTARTGGTVYIQHNRFGSLNWMYYGGIGSLATAGDSILRKADLAGAIAGKCPIHLADHTPNLTELDDFLDYVYAQGMTPMTVSQYWEAIDNVRYKEINVAKNQYKAINFFDDSTKVEKDGQIIFNDTFANIGQTIVDYYKAKNYHVAFWSDDSSEAMDAMYSNIPFLNGVACTFNPSDDKITVANHGLIALTAISIVYFSGDVAPAEITFGTNYYASKISDTTLKIAATSGGAYINITTAGTNVKIHSYSAREILGTSALKTAENHVDRTGAYEVSGYIFGCSINEIAYNLMRRKTGVSSTFTLTNLLVTGTIPDEFLQYMPSNLSITYHRLTGGMAKITESEWKYSLTALRLSYGLLAEDIPSNIGNLINITVLELYVNQITGSIPRSIGACVKLTNLMLYSNLMTGVIPIELSTLVLCQRFRLYSNGFSSYEAGAISVGMTVLVEVNLSINAITSVSDVSQIVKDCSACVTASSKALTLNVSGGTNASMADTNQGGIWGDFSGVAAPSDLAIALKNIDITKAGTVTLNGITAPVATGDGTGFPAGFGDWYRS